MRSKDELNKIKEEIEVLDKKLKKLTPEELEYVCGGECSIDDVIHTDTKKISPNTGDKV